MPAKIYYKPLSRFHSFLAEALPTMHTQTHGVLDVIRLSDKINVTREGIYKWLREGRIPVAQARKIVALRECEKKLEDFLKFLA